MPQLLVRDLDKATIDRLKEQAKSHGRSLQGEVKNILEEAAKYSWDQAREVAAEYRKILSRQKWSDSEGLIREDRER